MILFGIGIVTLLGYVLAYTLGYHMAKREELNWLESMVDELYGDK